MDRDLSKELIESVDCIVDRLDYSFSENISALATCRIMDEYRFFYGDDFVKEYYSLILQLARANVFPRASAVDCPKWLGETLQKVRDAYNEWVGAEMRIKRMTKQEINFF